MMIAIKSRKAPILWMMCSIALTACRHQLPNAYQTPEAQIEQQIAQAAASISQSLVKLQAMEEATKPQVKRVLNPPVHAISGNASVDWSGPIQSLLDRLANTSGYRLRVVGTAPAIPILITLQSTDAPLAEILRDVDFQAGAKASIRVYPDERVIELRYLKV